MEFNSQISTTRSQSERLLTLGVKKETADMAYEYKPKHLADTDPDKDWILVAKSPCGTDIPAWSLHRLLQIANAMFDETAENWYDDIIATIQSLIHLGYLNEEYLNMDIVNKRENKNMELLLNNQK